jgi:hypothetical protein
VGDCRRSVLWLEEGVLIEYAFWRLAGREVVQNDRYRDTRSV